MKTLPSDKFTAGYLAAAMWTECRDPQPGQFTEDDAETWLQRAPDEFIAESIKDCADFCESNAALLDGLDAGQCGQDFWLSRNGHGTGFWDRGLGDVGDALHRAAKVYGSVHFEFEGWFDLSYRCKCGEQWTRPETTEDETFGQDSCDACGAKVTCDYHEGRGTMVMIDEPEDAE